MCVCVCVCVRACVRACVCACVCMCYVRLCLCMYTRVIVVVCVYAYVRVCMRMRMRVRACVFTYYLQFTKLTTYYNCMHVKISTKYESYRHTRMTGTDEFGTPFPAVIILCINATRHHSFTRN